MKKISFYEKCKVILAHLEKNEIVSACEKAEVLLDDFPDKALSHFMMGLCCRRKQDIICAIRHFTLTLRADPSFISAAEILIDLNKDNYSVGELKYLYGIVMQYKKADAGMQQFLHQFADVPLRSDLSVPDKRQEEKLPAELPGVDDNAYIQHLITEMEKTPDVPASLPETPAADVPETAYRPPRPKAPAPPASDKRNGTGPGYGIETMTMAQLYIRQGLYENALDILVKLQKRDPLSERIKNEIERVQKCMREEKKE
jgi:tetratricopeptide (TPR) repeat protein